MSAKILVVDDTVAICDRIKEVLRTGDPGVTVLTAASGIQALKVLREVSIDLVLCDVVMPEMDGIKFLAHVKAHKEFSQTPIIMLSGKDDVRSKVRAFRAGAADYVTKPFDEMELLARVNTHLNLRRLQVELLKNNVRLEELAARDGLTGLFNHAYFQDRIAAEIKRCDRHRHELALLFIDIDHFKTVNDTHGHSAGDLILRGLADVLQGEADMDSGAFNLREPDVAARYGGDEFVVILTETNKMGAAGKAEQLRAHAAKMRFGGLDLGITLSIGVAEYPGDADDRSSLIDAADAAVYAAKELGRNRVMSFSRSLTKRAATEPIEKITSAARVLALERSIRDSAFRCVFQPIIDTVKRTVFAYEALSRPIDATFDNILDVVRTAEQVGQINQLGRVLRANVLADLSKLPEGCLLFFNVHPHELYEPDLLELADQLGHDAKRCVVEITEVAAITDYTRAGHVIDKLHERGFRIAIDDLASGFAGLHSLAQIDADFVKLDKSLISTIDTNPRTARLVSHILQYAANENILVIAEGIETRRECEVISNLECPLLQGFYLAKPQPGFVAVDVPDF